MATVTKPIALDESLNTTEQSSRNIADVLAQEIGNLVTVVSRIAPSTTVSWNQIQQSGTKIAQITINGTSTDVYAPTGGGGFSALIVITAATGQTVTVSKGGDTYTAVETSSGTYEVSVDSMGTWTVTDGTNTDTVAVSQQTTYYVTLSSVPDGRTVLPTDDISIWLACGGRSEAYTTLAEVLNDSTCLSALIADSNAVDYLVRSTTWASGITADSSAMSYIGLNNYASNTLLADSTWCSAICNSAYFESVLNVKVPTMTSDNKPSGVCFGYGVITGSPYYYAFDGDDSTPFSTDVAISNANVGYEFTEQKRIYMCKALVGTNATAESHYTFKVQGSTDRFSSDITDLSEAFSVTLANQGTTWVTKIFDTTKSAFRLFSTTQLEASRRMVVYTLQFYGRSDV